MNCHHSKPSFRFVFWTLLPFALVFLMASLSASAATTDPSSPDSDHDGYWDGPDMLLNMNGVLIWRIGEDKNANGKYEPKGQDGIWETQDDEFDPSNPSSHPTINPIFTYEQAAYWHDADGDGLTDAQEDKNLNGKYEPELGETNFQDADTDDDGLSDGFESGLAPFSKLPFFNANLNLDPRNPDTDGDGVPDGFELGVTFDPATGMPQTLAGGTRSATRIIPPVNPYVSGRYTNTDATFIYNGQARKCFNPASDPTAITDPTNSDSNYDGHPDGEGVTVNSDGLINLNGHEPGIGWASCDLFSTPEQMRQSPNVIQPVIINGLWDGGADNKRESDIFQFVYQNPQGVAFSESSTSAVKFDVQPLKKDEGNSTLPINVKIEHLIPEKRLWLVTVQLTDNYKFNVSGQPPSPQPTKTWVDPSSGGPGSTESSSIPIQPAKPIEQFWTPNSPCPGGDWKKPDFSIRPVTEICWGCVSPPPIDGHWVCPDKYEKGQNPSLSVTAFLPLPLVTGSGPRKDLLDGLLKSFYGIESTAGYDGKSDPAASTTGGAPTTREYLERQWILAMTFAEVGGSFNGGSIQKFQQEILLASILPASHYAYLQSPVGKNVSPMWVRKTKNKDKKLELNKIRLYDVLNSKYFGSVPCDAGDDNNAPKIWGNDDVQGFKWLDLMEYVADSDYKNTLRPQWKMKKLDDMIIAGNNTKDWDTYRARRKKYTQADVDAQNIFVKDLLQCAVIVKMAIEGNASILLDTNTQSSEGYTHRYLDNRFSRTLEPQNHHPAINNSPPYEEYAIVKDADGNPVIDTTTGKPKTGKRLYPPNSIKYDGEEYLGNVKPVAYKKQSGEACRDDSNMVAPWTDEWHKIYKESFTRYQAGRPYVPTAKD